MSEKNVKPFCGSFVRCNGKLQSNEITNPGNTFFKKQISVINDKTSYFVEKNMYDITL